MPTRYNHQGLLEKRTDTVTDVIGDNAQVQVREVLVPKIAKMTRNALNVMPVQFLYFQRLRTGRRCSCWGVTDDPDTRCRACYGAGVVGGYQKYGTRTHVLDVTSTAQMLNVAPNYAVPTRPIAFELAATAVYGYIETELEIKQNTGVLDDLTISARNGPQCGVDSFVRSGSDADWIPLTPESLQVRLGFRSLRFRFELWRLTPLDPLPALVAVRITYQMRPHGVVRADIPRVEESIALEDFGIYESWSSQTLFLDNELKSITTEDFFYNITDGTRWKVIGVKANEILGQNTSWDITCRLVQNYEPMQIVPIGQVPDPVDRPPAAIMSAFAARVGTEALAAADSPFPLQNGNPAQHTQWRTDEPPTLHVQQGPTLAVSDQAKRDAKR